MISDEEGDGGLSEPEDHEMLASSISLHASRSLNVSIPLHPDASSSFRASIPLRAGHSLHVSHSPNASIPLEESSSLDENNGPDESSSLNPRVPLWSAQPSLETESGQDSTQHEHSSLHVALAERLLGENNVEAEQEEEQTVQEQPEHTFDLTLPARHTYLGHNLKEFSGRTMLDEGVHMKLPLLEQKSVMLFPGQTLPMKLDSHSIDLQFFSQSNRTIGVVCFGCNDDMVTPIGVTAEIYEMALTDGGYSVKAKGRQRFKVLQLIMEGYDRISANVKVLPEIMLGPPLLEQRLTSLDRLRMKPTTEEEFRRQERIENRDAVVTPWPGWVYRQYDSQRLSSQIKKHLESINVSASIPEDPTNLSFWVAQNFLLDDNARHVLLNYDCAISRLQMEIKYLLNDKIFVCNRCDAKIGRRSNMLTMSVDGPLGIYCNSAGVIHDIVTLSQAQGLMLNSQTTVSLVFTWFHGYGWTIANCAVCHSHIGWKFTAIHPGLKPETFWALSRQNIKSRDE